MDCDDHAQWWPSEVTEHNHRNLTMSFDKDGLLLLVEGGAYESVDVVEDDSLVNKAHVEYDSRVFRKTKTCTLENVRGGGSGVGISVSDPSSHRVPVHILCSDFSCSRNGFRVRSTPEGGRRL